MKKTLALFLGFMALLLALSVQAIPPQINQAFYTLTHEWDYETQTDVEVGPYLALFTWWDNSVDPDFAYYLQVSSDGGRTWCYPGADCDGYGGAIGRFNMSVTRARPGSQQRLVPFPR